MEKKEGTSARARKSEGFKKRFLDFLSKPIGKTYKENVTPFVKRMRAIDAIPRSRLIWSSVGKRTYRKTHSV